MRKKIVIIIPTYNERENIGEIVPKIFAITDKNSQFEVEVLVVDDTSPDKTYQVVKQMQKHLPHLHLLLNKNKAGLGSAYLKGMKYAFEKLKAEIVFEFDADGSHDPQKLPEFFAKLAQGYDFVIGGRYKDGGSVDPDWPLIRKFYSVVGNLIIMLVLTDFRIRDWTSGFRAINKKVYQAVVPEMTSECFSGYTWQIGFLHKAVRKNFKICEVPIYFRDRQKGHSKLGSEYIKNTLWYIFRARMSEIKHSRVSKFLLVGAISALAQLGLTALLENWLHTHNLMSKNYLSLIQFLAAESAIVLNFTFNNIWTFKESKLMGVKLLLLQFGKFNLSAVGSILIQSVTLRLGLYLFANWRWGIVTPTLCYTALGIVLGTLWNYFAYNKFIWQTKKCN